MGKNDTGNHLDFGSVDNDVFMDQSEQPNPANPRDMSPSQVPIDLIGNYSVIEDMVEHIGNTTESRMTCNYARYNRKQQRKYVNRVL